MDLPAKKKVSAVSALPLCCLNLVYERKDQSLKTKIRHRRQEPSISIKMREVIVKNFRVVQYTRIETIRVDSSKFFTSSFATWLPVSRVPLNGLPVSWKSLILALTRIFFPLRRFDSVWVYWTWVKIFENKSKKYSNLVLLARLKISFCFYKNAPKRPGRP